MTDLRRHVPPLTLVWDDEAPGALHRTVDGTLVFADVSGFTALTERLSRQGRIGAEEIVEALNRVFGPMLTIAATRGGELLKFGGDALLFLFRGDDHAEQACDAAVEMRASLRAAAAVPTSAGRFSLSMSVGVHAGDIELFLVGSPTRELLVLGPGASAVAIAEKAAEAGQVVVSPATAARLSRRLHPPARRRAPCCCGAGGRTRRRAARHPCRPTRSSGWRPSSRPPSASSWHRGRRTPSTGWPPSRSCGSPAPTPFSHRRARRPWPSGCTSWSAPSRRRSRPRASPCWPPTSTPTAASSSSAPGVPNTREDDEGRMLRALRRIADADLPLPLQLGVNRGHVFAAEVGVAGARRLLRDGRHDQHRGPHHVHGARRGRSTRTPTCSSTPAPGSPSTPAGPFAMKGKAGPLAVYDVGEETGTREGVDDSRLPFLGRDEETATVRQALEDALGRSRRCHHRRRSHRDGQVAAGP